MFKVLICTISLFAASVFADDSLNKTWNNLVKKYKFDSSKQSYCFNKDNIFFGKNIDSKIRPASVSKVYTTFWALEKLSRHFRFETKFYFSSNNLYIQGGNDPFFVTENIFLALSKLNALGIKKIENIHFDKNFYLNWSDEKESISKILIKLFNTTSYSNSLASELVKTKDFALKDKFTPDISNFEMSLQASLITNQIDTENYIFSFYSSPLTHHLKQMNIYSNNFYADKIFEFMGGAQYFHEFIDKSLNTNTQEIKFETGSGLGENYTTCALTLKMLEKLNQTLISNSLLAQDIMSVPGSDAGTLRDRFRSQEYNRYLVAKTGTLRHTSTFSGYLFSKDITGFGIFNHTYDRVSARKLQNNFIKTSIKEFGDIFAIEYIAPKYISIKHSKIE